jgi:hypothetical protein
MPPLRFIVRRHDRAIRLYASAFHVTLNDAARVFHSAHRRFGEAALCFHLMPTSPPLTHEQSLRKHLSDARAERERARANPLASADRMAVRVYQQLRMANTHADLVKSERYGPAAKFFLTELYTTADLSQRDADIERVIRVLVKFLPDKALATLSAALEIDALSETLDGALARAARVLQGDQRPLRLDRKLYALAYHQVGEFEAREQQLDLVQQIGLSLDKLARMPLLLTLLKLMRGPAHAAGVGQLHNFLESGYAAFAHMKGGKEFVATIVSRERAEHQRLVNV